MSTGLAERLHLARRTRIARLTGRRRQAAEQVTFTDLAWDHFHWEEKRLKGTTRDEQAAQSYRTTREAFEARHGEIVGEYWSITQPSGVALTRRRAPALLRPFVDDVRRFHRATDWITRETPVIADVLFACEALAIKVTEVLRYTSESVAMRQIVAVASDLIGHVDAAGGKPSAAEAEHVARKQRAELAEIARYYRRAGVRIGRMVYTQGMVVGLLLMAALAAFVIVLLRIFGAVEWDRSLQTLVIAYGAGAIGAIVSVLQRMSSERFGVHYDLGKRNLYMLGSYRPVLGAVFGVFTYFLLRSDLLSTDVPERPKDVFYFGALAFVAGFSERFTRVLVKEASRTTGGVDPPAQLETAEEGEQELVERARGDGRGKRGH